MKQVNEILEKRGAPFRVKETTIIKPGIREKDGLVLKSVDDNSNCSPLIRADILELSPEEVADRLEEIYRRNYIDFDNSQIERGRILETVYPVIHNVKFLDDIRGKGFSYRHTGEFVTTYKVPVAVHEENDGSINITTSLLEMRDIALDDLHKAAIQNLPKISSVTSLAEIIGIDKDGLPPMLVVTNEYKRYGASMVLSTKVMESVANRLGAPVIVLPSSVHEILCIPYVTDEMKEHLLQTVREVNATMLKEGEWLSDTVYIWDPEDEDIHRF